jgi:hypothetical protein
MIQPVSSEVAKQDRKMRKATNNGYTQWRTSFIGKRVEQVEDPPQAFLLEMAPPATIPPHFHQVDQFQVFVAGSGTLGRNTVPAVALHYADHHTAYGPIISGPFGLSIFTIRAKSDPGSIRLDKPGYKDMLKPTKKRYLVAENIPLSTEPVLQYRSEVSLENTLGEIEGSDGLGAFILRLGAGMKTTGPDPRATGGQYYLVLNGSFQLEERSYPAWSIVYAGSTDAPLEVCAGPRGLETLVLNFPRSGS